MSIAAADYALTTTSEFFTYLGESDDDAGRRRDRAQLLINAYSKAVIRYIKRQFQPTEDAADKLFSYIGNGYLSLAPFEATEIYTVTIYTDLPESGWVVLPNQSATQESRWRPNPRHKTLEGTYWSLTLPEVGPFHPYYDEPVTTLNRRNLAYQVTVNADWGLPVEDVPYDCRLALWIAVANAWRNPEAFRQRSLGPLQFAPDMEVAGADTEGLSLPRAARSLLAPYRRRTLR